MMKCFFCFLIFSFCATILFAQESFRINHNISNASDTSLLKKKFELYSVWNNQWDNNLITNYYYNSAHQLSNECMLQYVNQISTVGVDSFEFSYYTNGTTKQINEYSWIPNATLTGVQLLHENQNGFVDTFTYKEYSTQTNSLLNNHRHVYQYNSSGKEILISHFEFDTAANSWLKSEQYISSYNVAGNKVCYLGQQWIDSTSNWVNLSIDSFAYDASNNQTQRITYHWIDSLSNWQKSFEQLDWWNSANQIDSTYILFADDSGKMKLNVQTFNTYTSDDLTQQLQKNFSQGIFTDALRTTYIINNDVLQNKIVETNNGSGWIKSGNDAYNYNDASFETDDIFYVWNNQWLPFTRKQTEWNDWRIGNNIADNLFTAFPNPTTSSEIYLHLPPMLVSNIEVMVFNSAGQLIYQHIETYNSIIHFDLPAVSNGNYFVEVIADGLEYSTHFIIQ